MAIGLDGLFTVPSGTNVSRTSLRQLNEQAGDFASLSATKVVVRKSQEVQRSATTATARTSATDVSQEDGISTVSANAEGVLSKGDETLNFVDSEYRDASSHLVIFDYDDTILPTFSLACSQRYGGIPQLVDPDSIRNELNQLTQAVLANLTKVIKVATLVIVTNASSEWFAQSCERYLPRVADFFTQHGIRVISARDRFENSSLLQKHWKYFIFIDLLEELFINQLKNGEPFSLSSIGDGSEERDACMKLASMFKNDKWIFKSLKLLTQPTVSYLIQQHHLLGKSLDNFLEMKTSADLCILFDKKKSEN